MQIQIIECLHFYIQNGLYFRGKGAPEITIIPKISKMEARASKMDPRASKITKKIIILTPQNLRIRASTITKKSWYVVLSFYMLSYSLQKVSFDFTSDHCNKKNVICGVQGYDDQDLTSQARGLKF